MLVPPFAAIGHRFDRYFVLQPRRLRDPIAAGIVALPRRTRSSALILLRVLLRRLLARVVGKAGSRPHQLIC